MIPVTGEVPRRAEFAVRIQGDSMEPYIADGSRVYVNRDRADADVLLPPDSGRMMVCFGRVMLPQRPPVPGQ